MDDTNGMKGLTTLSSQCVCPLCCLNFLTPESVYVVLHVGMLIIKIATILLASPSNVLPYSTGIRNLKYVSLCSNTMYLGERTLEALW
jgi:hypothetical protein